MKHSLQDLVDGGDWACSWACCSGLRAVCEELTLRLEPELVERACRVIALSYVSMAQASCEWAALVEALRVPSRRKPGVAQSPRGYHAHC